MLQICADNVVNLQFRVEIFFGGKKAFRCSKEETSFLILNLTVITTTFCKTKKSDFTTSFWCKSTGKLGLNHANSIMPTKKKSKSIPIGKIVKSKKGNNPYIRKRGL